MDNLFQITHTINITGRGFVVGGQIKQGIFHVGDDVQIYRDDLRIALARIKGIEFLNFGSRNSDRTDNIAFLLTDFGDTEIRAGDFITGM